MPPRRPFEDDDSLDDLEELEIYDEKDFEFDYDDDGKPTQKHHDVLGYLDYMDEDEDMYDDEEYEGELNQEYEDELETNIRKEDDEEMGPEDELPFKPVEVDGGDYE